MKRPLTSFVVTLGVPATVLFALTANPARLYAEVGLPPPACSAPEVTSCADASAGTLCAYDGGPSSGVCTSSTCSEPDAGFVTALKCMQFVSNCATQPQLDDCVGKSVGDSCGSTGSSGNCGLLNCPIADGGTEPTLACLYTGAEIPPEAGPKEDASPSGDASPGDSGKPGSDGSTTNPSTPPASDDEGCSCAMVGGPSGALGSSVGLLVAALAMMRRRRRPDGRA
jgi:MYXO-CTERM domain-containing protein